MFFQKIISIIKFRSEISLVPHVPHCGKSSCYLKEPNGPNKLHETCRMIFSLIEKASF